MKKLNILFLLTLLVLLLISSESLYSGENLNNAWNSFINNKYQQSLESCKKAISENDVDKSDALLLSILINDFTEKKENSFTNIKTFINSNSIDNVNPYIFGMWLTSAFASATREDDESDLIEYLEELTKSPKINGTIKAWICEMLSTKYKNQYKFSKAIEWGKKVGKISDWQAVGTFENISESGFDKDFGVLQHPENNYIFTNNNGAGVNWFNIVKPIEGAWINLEDNFEIANSVIYTQTFCTSPTAQNCQLRIGTSGSLKVWLNDILVISESEERNNGIDTYITNITLNQGVNRILLQIGSSEIKRNNFLIRFTDTQGVPLQNLTYSTISQPYKKGIEQKYEILPSFSEEYFKAKIKSEPNNLLNYLLLSNCLIINEKMPEARHTLLDAQKIAPNCSYIMFQLLLVYLNLDNRTDFSLLWEKMRKIDPDNPNSINYEYEEALKNEKYDEARTYLEKYHGITANKAKYYIMKINLAYHENNTEEQVKTIETAYKELPNDISIMRMEFYFQQKYKKDMGEALDIILKYLDKHYDLSVIDDLAALYKDLGKTSKFLNLYEKVIENQPNSIQYLYDIADYYYESRDYLKAIEYYNKCVEIAPYVSIYHEDIGNAYKELDKKEEAIKEYKQCIKYNPYSFTVREKLRKLENKKSGFEYFTEPDLYKVYESSKSNTFSATDNAVILNYNTNKVAYENGAFEEKTYLLIKILSSKGIDRFKEFNVFYYHNQDLSIEKAEVLKSSGGVIKAEVNGSQIVFPQLTEGDAISIIYKLQNYQFGALSPYFWDKQWFDSYYPCLEKKISLLVSPNAKFEYKWLNSNYTPDITKVDDWMLYTWLQKDKKPIKSESYMPNLVDFTETLDISSIPSWDFVSKWYYDIANHKAKSRYETKDAISEIFPNGVPSDKLTAVKAIYTYIVKNIRYSHVSFRQSGLVPQSASNVLNTRIGDCKDVSTLFVALCREINIDANWVLVCTRNYGQKYLSLPSIDFNHCIATTTIDGKKYYVELTSDMLPFGCISNGIYKALTLEVNGTGTNDLLVLNPTERMQNGIDRNIDVSFEKDKMTVNVNSIRHGGFAESLRESYQNKSPEEQQKTMAESIGSEYPNLKLKSMELGDELYTIDDTVTYKYTYTVNNVFNEFSNLSIFKVPYEDELTPSDALSTDDRKCPFDLFSFISGDYLEENLSIAIPDGKRLSEIPKSVNLTSDYGTYTLEFSLDENTLLIKRRLVINHLIVQPSDFNKLNEFLQVIIKNDNKQLAFKDL